MFYPEFADPMERYAFIGHSEMTVMNHVLNTTDVVNSMPIVRLLNSKAALIKFIDLQGNAVIEKNK